MIKAHWGQAYADAFDRLSLDNVGDLQKIAHENIHFKDPFNEFQGVEKMVRLMAQMFEDTTNPKFDTNLVLTTGQTCLIKWHFRCKVKHLGDLAFDGITEAECDEAGLITRHIDYWDSGIEVYAKLPILGRAVHFVRRRLALRG